MQDKIIEQRKLLKVGCYKWHKYKESAPERAKCPWGYIEIQPNCQHCIWFSLQKVSADKQAVIFDREVNLAEANELVMAWQEMERVSKAAPIDPHTMQEERREPRNEIAEGQV